MYTKVYDSFPSCQLWCTIHPVVNREEGTRLGRELKEARDAAGLSLRAVAEGADVSPAYVQKLERGDVRAPSPRRLERLAGVLGLDYGRLMAAAGYVVERPGTTKSPLEAKLASASLTQVEEQAVAAFIDHLKSQRESE